MNSLARGNGRLNFDQTTSQQRVRAIPYLLSSRRVGRNPEESCAGRELVEDLSDVVNDPDVRDTDIDVVFTRPNERSLCDVRFIVARAGLIVQILRVRALCNPKSATNAVTTSERSYHDVQGGHCRR